VNNSENGIKFQAEVIDFLFLKSFQKGYCVHPASIFGTRGSPGVKESVFGGHTTNTVYGRFTFEQVLKSHERSTGIVSLLLEPRLSIKLRG
jgi:hypothetical protein